MELASDLEWAEVLAETHVAGLRSQALMMATLLRSLIHKGVLTEDDADQLVAEFVEHSLLQSAFSEQAPRQPTDEETLGWKRLEKDMQVVAVWMRRFLGLKLS